MPADDRHELLFALRVSDQQGYASYRAAMTPILTRFGGHFRFDAHLSETLLPERGRGLNRLFIMSFPDEPTASSFFADADYLAVREEHFEPSVEVVEALGAVRSGGNP